MMSVPTDPSALPLVIHDAVDRTLEVIRGDHTDLGQHRIKSSDEGLETLLAMSKALSKLKRLIETNPSGDAP
jgi:hypothetical protein